MLPYHLQIFGPQLSSNERLNNAMTRDGCMKVNRTQMRNAIRPQLFDLNLHFSADNPSSIMITRPVGWMGNGGELGLIFYPFIPIDTLKWLLLNFCYLGKHCRNDVRMYLKWTISTFQDFCGRAKLSILLSIWMNGDEWFIRGYYSFPFPNFSHCLTLLSEFLTFIFGPN